MVTRGLAASIVYPVAFRNVAAMVSDGALGSMASTEANAIAHHSVVDELFQRGLSIIPCRFGTIADDEKGVLALLKKGYHTLMAKLARLAGKSEWSVRIFPTTLPFENELRQHPTDESLSLRAKRSKLVGPDCFAACAPRNDSSLTVSTLPTPKNEPPTAPAILSTGTAYLSRKKQTMDARQGTMRDAGTLTADLNAATSPHWEEVGREEHPAGGSLLCSLHYLVKWGEMEFFRQAFFNFQREVTGWKLQFSGPWPPYFFSEMEIGQTPRVALQCAG